MRCNFHTCFKAFGGISLFLIDGQLTSFHVVWPASAAANCGAHVDIAASLGCVIPWPGHIPAWVALQNLIVQVVAREGAKFAEYELGQNSPKVWGEQGYNDKSQQWSLDPVLGPKCPKGIGRAEANSRSPASCLQSYSLAKLPFIFAERGFQGWSLPGFCRLRSRVVPVLISSKLHLSCPH